jgi:Uma2 family endonuclease
MKRHSVNYGRILRNLMRLLDATCGHSLYEVLPKGVQVWLPEQALGVYPDVIVIAGAPLLYDGQSDKVTNPCLAFEIVYGPDRPEQPLTSTLFNHCRSVPYLQEYVFVHQQDTYIEQWYRLDEDRWGYIAHRDRTSVAELTITNTRLPLMDVYEQVEFEPSEGGPA